MVDSRLYNVTFQLVEASVNQSIVTQPRKSGIGVAGISGYVDLQVSVGSSPLHSFWFCNNPYFFKLGPDRSSLEVVLLAAGMRPRLQVHREQTSRCARRVRSALRSPVQAGSDPRRHLPGFSSHRRSDDRVASSCSIITSSKRPSRPSATATSK